ncbi:probable RNA-binding protein CG14230 [Drosophila novamexicana]|uniref:probable RNA-binding protein CG14230 n=1 Tax=Drosophila novamexicana TaxID=47314 RepID=UPI0011E605AB|nr:probable RNA-binding protein CG14230 [Drosophila novamexicana]
MGSTRFFLADLPAKTTEHDLRALFQDYGDVERVELKTKEQFVDSGQTIAKVIAFVTAQTDDADYCVNELNWQRLHGAKLKVSLAKESFLDRLKRERDEGQQSAQESHNASESNQSSSRLLAQNTQNKRRVFGEHEEINDEDVAPELLITKKRAAHSLINGKIVIQQEHDVKPLHIIEQHRKPVGKQLDAKAAIADLKRKESLNKMKLQHEQKKTAIQQALASTAAGQAKRIKFSDAEEEDEVTPKPKKEQPKKALFEDDEEDEQEEEVLLPQHSGKKGERLVEMQSKQSLDPRFRITANFVAEDDEDEAEAETEDAAAEQKQQDKAQDSERNWQMGILEQVIGRKIDSSNAPGAKASKNKKMLRFDPAKEEHQQMLRVKSKKEDNAKPQPKAATAATAEDAARPAPVSQNAFYVVTDTLKQSLKTRGEGFSLLEMFGSSHEVAVAERQDQLEKLGHEKILVNKSNKLGLGQVNPFSYDSSDSDDDNLDADAQQQALAKENEAPVKKPGKQKQKKSQIFTETFFIPKNDARLKEGAKLFKSSKPELENENYDEVKKRLKFLITKKIAKTQKNISGKDVKKNKNKKRNKF